MQIFLLINCMSFNQTKLRSYTVNPLLSLHSISVFLPFILQAGFVPLRLQLIKKAWVEWEEHLGPTRHWLQHVHPTFYPLFVSLIFCLPSIVLALLGICCLRTRTSVVRSIVCSGHEKQGFTSAWTPVFESTLVPKQIKMLYFPAFSNSKFSVLLFTFFGPSSLHARWLFSLPFICCTLPHYILFLCASFVLCWLKPLLRPYRNIICSDSFHQISTISPGVVSLFLFFWIGT